MYSLSAMEATSPGRMASLFCKLEVQDLFASRRRIVPEPLGFWRFAGDSWPRLVCGSIPPVSALTFTRHSPVDVSLVLVSPSRNVMLEAHLLQDDLVLMYRHRPCFQTRSSSDILGIRTSTDGLGSGAQFNSYHAMGLIKLLNSIPAHSGT